MLYLPYNPFRVFRYDTSFKAIAMYVGKMSYSTVWYTYVDLKILLRAQIKAIGQANVTVVL